MKRIAAACGGIAGRIESPAGWCGPCRVVLPEQGLGDAALIGLHRLSRAEVSRGADRPPGRRRSGARPCGPRRPWLPPLVFALTLVLPGAARAERGQEPIRPIPALPALDMRMVALGDRLFHDPRLSGDGSVSCASCHDLARNGADGRPRPVGAGGVLGPVRTLTVYNSALNFVQFWNGGAATLEAAVDQHLTDPLAMGRFQLGRSIPPAHVRAIVAFLVTLAGERPGATL